MSCFSFSGRNKERKSEDEKLQEQRVHKHLTWYSELQTHITWTTCTKKTPQKCQKAQENQNDKTCTHLFSKQHFVPKYTDLCYCLFNRENTQCIYYLLHHIFIVADAVKAFSVCCQMWWIKILKLKTQHSKTSVLESETINKQTYIYGINLSVKLIFTTYKIHVH